MEYIISIFTDACLSCSLIFTAGNTLATTVSAKITADNYYALYFGSDNGTTLTSDGTDTTWNNWRTAETYTFDVSSSGWGTTMLT